ncbi:MAG: alginate export family protein [Planctomycetota bacterium]|nr:alginate export family protein [Planctomycetota bacterium]
MNASPCRSTLILSMTIVALSATGLRAQPAEPAPKVDIPFGFLSDPAEPPDDLLDAILTGKVSLNNRLRFEFADTTGRKSSFAATNRIRLGYGSKPFHGFSGFVEMENVATLDADNYFVPATSDGDPSRTVIADPTGTEVNQAFLRFQTDSVADSGASFEVKAGRQRIKLDDDRFIGNVGWRQFEQTYDAVRIQSNLGVEGLAVQYAYVWRVQRIFGPDGPNWDSDSHFINVSYAARPELRITPFLYLLDFEDDSPGNSVNTYGVRLTGDIARQPDDEEDFYFAYEFTYARQTDAGDNPVDFEADFLAVEGSAIKEGLGSATAGYQFLGSDDGTAGFRFPLGTNHKFQGFADQFLVTPATGLQDLYLGGSLDLPQGIKAAATAHRFWSDEGGTDLGSEVDLTLSKRITPNWSVLLKAALFDGHNGQPDTARVWAQTTFQF